MNELKLSKKISITLPGDGEQFGIDNLKAFAQYGAKSYKKIRKFTEDGKYSLLEKLRSVSVLTGLFKFGKQAQVLKDEFFDQTDEEQNEIIQVFIDEFGWTPEVAKDYYTGIIDIAILVYDAFEKDKGPIVLEV